MTIRFWRSGSPSFGLEVDDGGIARSWLSSGAAVGRFERALTPSEQEALDRGLARAGNASAEPSTGPVHPGATSEHLLTESLDIAYPSSAGPPDACRELVDALRALLDDLVASPVAAIVLEVSGPPYRGRLRHVGTEPVAVRMEELTMTVVHFGRDDTIESSREVRVDAPSLEASVEAGWELQLPPPDKAASDGGFVAITVGPAEVDVQGDGVLRPVEFGWTSE